MIYYGMDYWAEQKEHMVKGKTFFSQWGPPTLMGGIFVVLGVFGFVAAA